MRKVILITGATDGIGRQTARRLVESGNDVVVHGRSSSKLEDVRAELSKQADGRVETFRADLSVLAEVEELAAAVATRHERLDVLINNAGVFTTPDTVTSDGLDVRFAVNTVAPYLLTRRLLPLLGTEGRVVNVSSAAQAPVDLDALAGSVRLDDGAAYAQSKLALTMWSRGMAEALGCGGPSIIAVNPGSFLGTKMVRDAYGKAGNDISIGADVLCRAALSSEFVDDSGKYFDNDAGRFGPPHPDALDPDKCGAVVRRIEEVLRNSGE